MVLKSILCLLTLGYCASLAPSSYTPTSRHAAGRVVQHSEASCLAAIMYYEARGEGIKGQQAVAHVSLNRARKAQKSLCWVLKQPGQYSFMGASKIVPKAPKAFFNRAANMISEDYKGLRKDFTKGAMFFFHKDHHSWLTEKLVHVKIVGNHKFMKLREKS